MADLVIREEAEHGLFTAMYRDASLEIEPGWEQLCCPVRSYAAWRDGVLLGAATVSRRFERLVLDYIAVLPEARGQGIGRRLTAACLAYAGGTGERELWLAARTPAFFRSLGAEDTGGTALLSECLECSDYGRLCYPREMKFAI